MAVRLAGAAQTCECRDWRSGSMGIICRPAFKWPQPKPLATLNDCLSNCNDAGMDKQSCCMYIKGECFLMKPFATEDQGNFSGGVCFDIDCSSNRTIALI